jgi:ankyrin repeat protein
LPEYVPPETGYSDVVRFLMESGADANDTRYVVSPLADAVLDGNIAAVRTMAEYGADLTVRNESNRTLLHHAAFRGHPELVRYLIERGIDVNSVADDGTTPLMDAARMPGSGGGDTRLEVVRLLVGNGAYVNARDDRGRTPLHRAASDGFLEGARLLIENGADVNARTERGTTPLQEAMDGQYPQVAELIRAHGGGE